MDWLEIVGVIFEIAVFSALAAAAAYFITWIKAKKHELEKKINDETAKKYLDMLEKTVVDCVLATNQTYVNDLKKAGAFDKDAQKTAFQRTYDAVTAVITDDAQKCLNEVIKDLGAYITNKIEAQICASK